MRSLEPGERAAVEWFASRTDEPLRQQILADLNASQVVEIRDEQLVLRFCVAGYTRPDSPNEKELPIAAEVMDADGERLIIALLMDENSRLSELELTRLFSEGPVVAPNWESLREVDSSAAVTLNDPADPFRLKD